MQHLKLAMMMMNRYDIVYNNYGHESQARRVGGGAGGGRTCILL